jgi:hypothetical protein
MANLRIAELDFDAIKSNLKEYLQSQDTFSDYDFEGSGLSILLDILAYNTHYNAYLANMVVNEMFLDSAVKRSSAVSIAKHLGYTPTSITGSTAVLDVTVTNPSGNPTSLTLERYTTFTSTINSTTYNFLTIDPVTATPVDGAYIFNDVTVKEGTQLQYSYTVVSPGPDEKYEIPNSGVDVSTLYVTVQTSSSDSTTEVYTRATDTTTFSNASLVYYLEENTLGNYQIYFGDNILGKKLTAGNIVKIEYLVCVGAETNVSNLVDQTFGLSGTIGGSSNVVIQVASNSTGGADRESISSIKFNALRSYQSRNRAVTKADYSDIIKTEYPNIEAVSVWGGEENIPPNYGKVYISLKPYEGFIVSNVVKEEIKTQILAPRQMLTVSPEFVDPDYIYVNLLVNIEYNKNLTTLSSSSIASLARSEVNDYFSDSLQQFNLPFYYSQLLQRLTNINPSVLNVLSEVRIQKRITPILNVGNSYVGDAVIKFNNKLHPNGLQSTRFFITQGNLTVPVRMADQHLPVDGAPDYEGTGEIYLYNPENNITIDTIGTINYATGDVIINSFTPTGFPTGMFDIRITCEAQESSYNITSSRNQIIVLDDTTESESSNRISGLTIIATPV